MTLDLAFDRHHLWHPYTSAITPLPVYPVVSAEGVYLHLEDGRTVIDGMSSWWSAIHGYNHPVLNRAMKSQIDAMSHVMFGGLTHEPAISLGKLLVDLTPPSLEWVFLTDSGSVAVEVALKMALQHWVAQGKSEKRRIATVRHGYHGDTAGAMAVSDPTNGMHALFAGYLPQHLFVAAPPLGYDRPLTSEDLAELEMLFEEHHHTIAAFIIEPVVQGAGGMRIYNPTYLTHLRKLCSHYEVLLIIDEIATGFGRTGTLFASEQADVEADILCIGKALTGGQMTLGATMTTKKIAETISSNGGVMMHGPTFMANPLACATAVASLKLLTSSPWQERVHHIEHELYTTLSPLKAIKGVTDVRVLGAIGVVELEQPVHVAAMQEIFINSGLWLRPFGKLVYTMPPYIISPQECHTLTTKMAEGITQSLS